MKQSDLTSHVATQAALSKAKAHSPVDALFSAITEALAHDKSVVIPRFRHLHHQDARRPPAGRCGWAIACGWAGPRSGPSKASSGRTPAPSARATATAWGTSSI